VTGLYALCGYRLAAERLTTLTIDVDSVNLVLTLHTLQLLYALLAASLSDA